MHYQKCNISLYQVSIIHIIWTYTVPRELLCRHDVRNIGFQKAIGILHTI